MLMSPKSIDMLVHVHFREIAPSKVLKAIARKTDRFMLSLPYTFKVPLSNMNEQKKCSTERSSLHFQTASKDIHQTNKNMSA